MKLLDSNYYSLKRDVDNVLILFEITTNLYPRRYGHYT